MNTETEKWKDILRFFCRGMDESTRWRWEGNVEAIRKISLFSESNGKLSENMLKHMACFNTSPKKVLLVNYSCLQYRFSERNLKRWIRLEIHFIFYATGPKKLKVQSLSAFVYVFNLYDNNRGNEFCLSIARDFRRDHPRKLLENFRDFPSNQGSNNLLFTWTEFEGTNKRCYLKAEENSRVPVFHLSQQENNRQ